MNLDLRIAVGEETIPVVINRRKQSRYLRLRLNYRNQVVVSTPWHCSNQKALRFVEKHREWLEKRLARVPGIQTVRQWLVRHPYLSAHGERLTVTVCMESISHLRPGYQIGLEKRKVVFDMPENHAHPDTGLQKLVRSFASDVLADRIKYYARRLNLEFKKLGIRDQISRWGSCSANGSISLNWRLALIAPELQDYVILHELAHLSEMNHSYRFRMLLDQYDPGCVAHEAALSSITAEIMRIGR